MDRTLVIVKPDGVERGLAGEVLSRLERKKLRLVAAELRTLSRETAETHYAEHAERQAAQRTAVALGVCDIVAAEEDEGDEQVVPDPDELEDRQ